MYIIHRQQKWTADRFPKRKLFGVESGKKASKNRLGCSAPNMLPIKNGLKHSFK